MEFYSSATDLQCLHQRASLFSKILHMGHYGINKMTLRARESVFWPGTLNHIRTLAETCTVCQENSKSQLKETQQQIKVSLHAWETGHRLIGTKQRTLSIHCRLLQQIPSLEKTQQSKHTHNSTTLETNILRIWHPKICSDKWRTIIQHSFKTLQKFWCFQHIKSSFHHPQSNGLAEICSNSQSNPDQDYSHTRRSKSCTPSLLNNTHQSQFIIPSRVIKHEEISCTPSYQSISTKREGGEKHRNHAAD